MWDYFSHPKCLANQLMLLRKPDLTYPSDIRLSQAAAEIKKFETGQCSEGVGVFHANPIFYIAEVEWKPELIHQKCPYHSSMAIHSANCDHQGHIQFLSDVLHEKQERLTC